MTPAYPPAGEGCGRRDDAGAEQAYQAQREADRRYEEERIRSQRQEDEGPPLTPAAAAWLAAGAWG